MVETIGMVLVVLAWLLVWYVHRNTLMNALLFWLSGYLRCRLILDSGKDRNMEPYLERYYLGTIPLTGRHVYLHRFLASDSSNLHDHPWRWAMSFIICGRYLEDRRWGRSVVRWFNWLTGESFHRVELIPDVYTWTIFVVGPRCKPWGMMEPALGEALGAPDSQMYRTSIAGDTAQAFIWTKYEYGAKDKNEDAIALRWFETYPRGNQSQRQRRDYVRSK